MTNKKFDKFSCDKRWWLIQLRGHGFSQQEIATMLNVSQQTIAYHLGELKKKLIIRYPFLDPIDD